MTSATPTSQNNIRIGWLSTGNGEGSLGLLRAVAEAHIPNIEIAYVCCSREPGEAEGSDRFIQYAKQLGIPVVTLSWRKFKHNNATLTSTEQRRLYDNALHKLVKDHNPQLIIMAGYMLITHELHKLAKCLNLHPALPDGPTGKWDEVGEQLVKYNAQHSGVTIHEVTDDLDGGPPLTFCRYPISGLDATAIRERGLQYERALIVQTLVALGTEQISLTGKTTPVDLTKQLPI